MKKSLIGIVLILMILSLVGGAAVAQSPTYVDPPTGFAGPVYEMPRMPTPEELVGPEVPDNWFRANIIVRDEDEFLKRLYLDLCPTPGRLHALVPEIMKPYNELQWFSEDPNIATVFKHEVADVPYDSTATVTPVGTGATWITVVVQTENRIYYDTARVFVSECAEGTLTGSAAAPAGTNTPTTNVAGETIAAAAEGSKDAAAGEPVEVAAGEPAAAAGTNSSLVYAGAAIGLLMIVTLLFVRRRQSAS